MFYDPRCETHNLWYYDVVKTTFYEYSVEPLLLSTQKNEILPVGHNITDIWLLVMSPQYRPGRNKLNKFSLPQTAEE
jgi:hypothetical protein